jgi:uncharacterized membrane protein
MSDNQQKDVLIAVYMFEDLARQDFDAVMKLAESKTITVEGVVVVQKDSDGEVHVTETGDGASRSAAAWAWWWGCSPLRCWLRPRSEPPPAAR